MQLDRIKGPAHSQKNIQWSSEGHDPIWTSVFLKLFLNGASHDTKIGCIRLVWAGTKIINFQFCYAHICNIVFHLFSQ